MDAEGIYLKKVDRKAYRKLKSVAAERGVPVYKVLNEAITAYIESQRPQRSGEGAASQDELDNAAYSTAEADPSLQGRWVGIANGRVVATSDGETGAVRLMRQLYSKSAFRHGIVAQVGKAREEGQWLAGSLQQE